MRRARWLRHAPEQLWWMLGVRSRCVRGTICPLPLTGSSVARGDLLAAQRRAVAKSVENRDIAILANSDKARALGRSDC